jgi:hypothetical protein
MIGSKLEDGGTQKQYRGSSQVEVQLFAAIEIQNWRMVFLRSLKIVTMYNKRHFVLQRLSSYELATISGDTVEHHPDSPPYTAAELTGIFLDFYKALATFRGDEVDLKIISPKQWPSLTRECCANFKSYFVIELLRHLPYSNSDVALN